MLVSSGTEVAADIATITAAHQPSLVCHLYDSVTLWLKCK